MSLNINNTWVVVADTSYAKIFSTETPSRQLQETETLAHRTAHLHQSDLASDWPSRDRNSVNGSHNTEREPTPKKRRPYVSPPRYMAD
ncbi:MAG: host attachment protein [Gammaproteobacteria bacterium]|nr:host attachment protein [Gammaproteobacteria bacterium]